MSDRLGFYAACFLPGLPHLLLRNYPQYAVFADAIRALGDQLEAAGIKRLMYYSTQWLSVLGQSVQTRATISGKHLDQTWYDFGEIPYHFIIDQQFSYTLIDQLAKKGFQVRGIDYEGFYPDTGTIVADHFLNQSRFSCAMLACSLYSNFQETRDIAAITTEIVASDSIPTALICVSSLSYQWFPHLIDLNSDMIFSGSDDRWNRELIQRLESGMTKDLESYLAAAKTEVRFDKEMKALAMLAGAGILSSAYQGSLLAYGAIYGTGGAVLKFSKKESG